MLPELMIEKMVITTKNGQYQQKARLKSNKDRQQNAQKQKTNPNKRLFWPCFDQLKLIKWEKRKNQWERNLSAQIKERIINPK